jgi:hypothetical protein
VRQLSERLRDPEAARAEAARFVGSFIRPHGIDRPATPIFVDAIERLAAAPAPVPVLAPAWGVALRPILLGAALPAGVVGWMMRDDPLKPLRRRWEKRAYQARKVVGRSASIAARQVRWTKKTVAKQWEKTVVKPIRAARRSFLN